MRWKTVKDFENYRVSDTGIVESNHSGTWTPLKTTFKDKYPKVALSKNGIRYDRQVHDLVLEAFVGPKPAKAEVCHWDGNHQNNRLENLRYGDHIENAKDRLRHSLDGTRPFGVYRPHGEKNSQSKLTTDKVKIIKELLTTTNMTHREIAKKFGVARSSISMINCGKIWTND